MQPYVIMKGIKDGFLNEAANRLLKKPASVIARRAKPGVAIQTIVDFIDFLDGFASLAMTIFAGFLSFSAAY